MGKALVIISKNIFAGEDLESQQLPEDYDEVTVKDEPVDVWRVSYWRAFWGETFISHL